MYMSMVGDQGSGVARGIIEGGGGHIHIFVFTDYEDNRFQKKLILHCYATGPSQSHNYLLFGIHYKKTTYLNLYFWMCTAVALCSSKEICRNIIKTNVHSQTFNLCFLIHTS